MLSLVHDFQCTFELLVFRALPVKIDPDHDIEQIEVCRFFVFRCKGEMIRYDLCS